MALWVRSFALVALGILAGCGPVGARYTTQTTTPVVDDSGCSTSVIDYGLKGTVVATQRGLWSDTKIIPGTNTPAVAYYDGSATGGALNIKFAFWNGSQYSVENVAGDALVAAGSASFVRLAFLSTGVPMVFWATTATTVKMAMRNASLSTASSTWTVAVLDTVTGAATRALEVAVSPLDQVAVIYLTNTTVAGRARFIYCDQNCSSPFSFVTMTATSDTIEAANIVAAQVGTGVAWCKNSSSDYRPAVVFGGNTAASVRYGICQGGLSSCTTSAGWTLLTVTGSANTNSKLYIDSTVTGDQPKILTKNAASVQLFSISEGCNATPSNVVANANTVGDANTGTAWLDLLKDSSGKFHILGNQSTTSVRYFNSVGTTAASTTWNGAGVVQTTTLPAVGAGAGGADLATGSTNIYASYGYNVAPFNLEIGGVTNYNSASDVTAFSAANPDQSGHLQIATSQTRSVSVRSTTAGIPAVAYVDFSNGATAGARLKYALRAGTASTDRWTAYTVPGTGSPQFPSLAFDGNGKPWISYYDASNFRYFLVTNSSSDGSGTWTQVQFPLTTLTANPTLPATNDTSLTMWYSSGVLYPTMFVMNSSAGGSNGLKVAVYNPSTSNWSAVQTVDAMSTSFGSNVRSASLTTTGAVAVSYIDLTVNRVKYNYTTDPTSAFGASATISGLGQGQGLSLAISASTLKPSVSYFDQTNAKLYYAPCSNTLALCASSGGWIPEVVDGLAGVAGVSAAAGTGSLQMLQSSLSFFSTGVANIMFPRGIAQTGAFLRAQNSSGTFELTTASSGANANISGASAINFSMAGLTGDSTVTSLDELLSVYVGPGNWLYSTSCRD